MNNWHFSNIALNASNPPNATNLPEMLIIGVNSFIFFDRKLELSDEDLSYGLYYCDKVLTKKYLQSKIYFENTMMSRYAIHLAEDAH